jgi:hypothetical protein
MTSSSSIDISSDSLYSINNDCLSEVNVPFSFMVGDRCMKYHGYTSTDFGSYRYYQESKQSVQKNGGGYPSGLGVIAWGENEGKYVFWTPHTSDRYYSCVSKDHADVIGDGMYEMEPSDWSPCKYTDTDTYASGVDMSISCGCYQDNDKLSTGDTIGIVVGSILGLLFMIMVALGIYKCKKSRKIPTSDEPVENVMVAD